MTTTNWPQLGVFSDVLPVARGEWQQTITYCQQLGLTGLQLQGPLLQELLAEPERAPALRTTLNSAGISVVGLAGYRNLVAYDEGRRRANIELLKQCLRLAPELGTTIVATETGTRHPTSDWIAVPENRNPETWDLFYSVLDELLPVAEQHGTVLALEGYVNNVVATVDQIEQLMQRYPTPALQVMLDPYNYLSASLLPQSEQVAQNFLQRLEPHFVLAHLKDVAAEGAEVNTPEFGTGVFPQQLYIDFLRTRRPDLPLVFEHLPWEHLPNAIKRLENFLQTT